MLYGQGAPSKEMARVWFCRFHSENFHVKNALRSVV